MALMRVAEQYARLLAQALGGESCNAALAVHLPGVPATLTYECLIKSQVRHDQATRDGLVNFLTKQMVEDFLASRREGISHRTLEFYRDILRKFVGHPLTPQGINEYLHSLNCGNGKHAHYRTLRALCNWMFRQGYLV